MSSQNKTIYAGGEAHRRIISHLSAASQSLGAARAELYALHGRQSEPVRVLSLLISVLGSIPGKVWKASWQFSHLSSVEEMLVREAVNSFDPVGGRAETKNRGAA